MLKAAFALFIITIGLGAFAQEKPLELLEFPKEKRLFTIEARLGYYWDLQSPPDSLPVELYDFYKDMGRGPRADFAILYNWKDNLNIGFNYAFFKTTALTNPLMLTYLYNNGSQRTLSGSLSGTVRQHYFAIRVDPHFEIGKSFAISPGVTSGIITYQNITRIDSLYQRISGYTMAFELRLGLEYYLNQNWSINLNGAYMLSFLHEPDIDNSFEEISTENLSAGLSKWYLGLGVRYNFTQKGSAGVIPSKRPDSPGPGKKRRFD